MLGLMKPALAKSASMICGFAAAAATLFAPSHAFAQGFVGPYAYTNWQAAPPGGFTTSIEPGGAAFVLNCGSADGDWFANNAFAPGTAVSFDWRLRGHVAGPLNVFFTLTTGNNGQTFGTNRDILPLTAVPTGVFNLSGTSSFSAANNEFTLFMRIGARGSFAARTATLEIRNFTPGFRGGLALSNLTLAGSGVAPTPLPEELVLRYSGSSSAFLTPLNTAFTAVAPCSGNVSFNYNFSGAHLGGSTFAYLEAFSELDCGTVSIVLVNNPSVVGQNPFTFTGSVPVLPVQQGKRFGVRVGGQTIGASTFNGTLRLTNFTACVPTLVVPTAPCTGDADGNRAVNFLDITTVLSNFGAACP